MGHPELLDLKKPAGHPQGVALRYLLATRPDEPHRYIVGPSLAGGLPKSTLRADSCLLSLR